jgi:large subunit ribosomal protein L4
MLKVNILNSKFETTKKQYTLELSEECYSVASVHQVVKATLANRRQGTHSTKTRGLVRGGGIKPFKQKGTGRARQGSIRSPLMPGGGTAFGPTPRDYSQKVNKKAMLAAIRTTLFDKANNGKLLIVEKYELSGKTKELNTLLNERGLKNGYIITETPSDSVLRAARNIPTMKSSPLKGFSVYEAMKYENLIITEKAIVNLMERLG